MNDRSTATEDYVKTIYSHTEWQDEPITPSQLAARLGLAASTVTEMVKKLAAQGLVDHRPYGSVELTGEGRLLALRLLRRHRIIETWLVMQQGYGWDEVHDEAEQLEHAVSDLMIERIDTLLGHPVRDPHGDPIPTADGRLLMPQAIQLTLVPLPAKVMIERIADDDPALLQHCDECGIKVGSVLEVTEGAPYSSTFTVTHETPEGTRRLTLGRPATDAIYVSQPEG